MDIDSNQDEMIMEKNPDHEERIIGKDPDHEERIMGKDLDHGETIMGKDDENKKKGISVMISGKTHQKILEICQATNQSKSSFLRDAIDSKIASEINGPEISLLLIRIANQLEGDTKKLDPELKKDIRDFSRGIMLMMNQEIEDDFLR